MKKYMLLLVSLHVFLFLSARQAGNHQQHIVIKQEGSLQAPPAAVYLETHKYFLYALPRQGRVAEHHETGHILYEGETKNKKLQGQWQSWYTDGRTCDSGLLVKGIPHGEWKHWDAAGTLIAIRTYDAGRYARVKNELVRYHPRRTSLPIVAMYHKRSKNEALARLSSLYSFPGGEANHAIHSLRQLVVSNVTPGKPYHPVFEQNLHHGLFMNFFCNGAVQDSGYYQNGLKEGVWTHYEQANGYFRKGAYRHGVKVSEWKYYQPDGKLHSISFYNKQGALVREKRFR